jgi:hypothetical protein
MVARRPPLLWFLCFEIKRAEGEMQIGLSRRLILPQPQASRHLPAFWCNAHDIMLLVHPMYRIVRKPATPLADHRRLARFWKVVIAAEGQAPHLVRNLKASTSYWWRSSTLQHVRRPAGSDHLACGAGDVSIAPRSSRRDLYPLPM